MAVLLKNNAVGKFGGAVTDTATSIPLLAGDGAKFPQPGAGDYFPVTFVKDTGELEIAHCTARVGDVLTVTRGREGTLALAFNAGERVSLRLTAQAITDIRDALQQSIADAKEQLYAPAGTRMLFQQTAAPAGWTKEVASYNNHALRLVTGSVGTGGTLDFTTAFATGRATSEDGGHTHTITVDDHTLTIDQIPPHSHLIEMHAGGDQGGTRPQGSPNGYNATDYTRDAGGGQPHNHGGSADTVAAHAHTLAMDVKYIDLILAVKD